jgi:hypothetical protein
MVHLVPDTAHHILGFKGMRFRGSFANKSAWRALGPRSTFGVMLRYSNNRGQGRLASLDKFEWYENMGPLVVPMPKMRFQSSNGS